MSVLLGLLLPILSATDILAQAPDSVSFQGLLTETGGSPLNATVSITFKLYKNDTAVWTETQPSVVVTDGIFNVLLGSVTPLDTVAFNQPIEIGIKVATDPEIKPTTPLAAAPYALGMRGMYAVWAEDGVNESFNVIGGAPNNSVAAGAVGATIGGGGGTDFFSAAPNTVADDFGTVGGGAGNTASLYFATVGGGEDNTASGNHGTVGGGADNTAGLYATVAGGHDNTASSHSSTVGGGSFNTAGGLASTVPGGSSNQAAGGHSLAAGRRAKANHGGTFVWADSSANADLVSTGVDQFLIRAAGGVAIGTNSPRGMLTLRGPEDPIMGPSLFFFGDASDQAESGRIRFVEGTAAANHRGAYIHYDGNANRLHIGRHNTNDTDIANDENVITIPRDNNRVGIRNESPGHPLVVGTDVSNGNGAHATVGGVWTNGSSRSFKDGFEEIDKIDVLERLAVLPVTRWRYRGDDKSEHIGPTAEDFREAFGLGHDQRYITTVDADGVALAAIQGLYEVVLAQQQHIAELEARLSR
ncbi:MAG TPA: tail fiber domain-containing protein [Candidatus Thermoplasmatota archaeon]